MVDSRDETYIDPQFFLPPNVYDIRYIDKDDTSENVEVEEIESPNSDSGVEDVDTIPEDDSLETVVPETEIHLPVPDNITVVSQTVKAAAGGGYLVDIVIDIPDMIGVENFDVAVTK